MRRFASSPAAPTYLATCERLGIDPAAPFADDDFMALQFRTALLVFAAPESEEDQSSPFDETRQRVGEMRRQWES